MEPMRFPSNGASVLSVKSRVAFGWDLKWIVCVANGFLMLFMHTAGGKARRRCISELGHCVQSQLYLSLILEEALHYPTLPTAQALAAFLVVWFGHESSTGTIRFVHFVHQLCFSQAFDIIRFLVSACVATGRTRGRIRFSLCTGVAIFKAVGWTVYTQSANKLSKQALLLL